jgi:hypothetical protein
VCHDVIVSEVTPPTSQMGLLLFSKSEPGIPDLLMGMNFTIAVYLDPTERVGGWGIELLEFCQDIANAEYILPGSEWTSNFDDGIIDNSLGTITDIQAVKFGDLEDYPQYNHTLCYINFTALDSGECTIRLVSLDVQDANFSESLPVKTHNLTLTIFPRPTASNDDDESTEESVTPTPVSIYSTGSSSGSSYVATSSSSTSETETISSDNENTPKEETEQDTNDETTDDGGVDDDGLDPVESNFEDSDFTSLTSTTASDGDASEIPVVFLALPLIAAFFIALLLLRKRK